MSTYGDYSTKIIKKIHCSRCKQPIKTFNLQLLLDQDRTLCPQCEALYPGNNKRNVLPKEDELDLLVHKKPKKVVKAKKAKSPVKAKKKAKK